MHRVCLGYFVVQDWYRFRVVRQTFNGFTHVTWSDICSRRKTCVFNSATKPNFMQDWIRSKGVLFNFKWLLLRVNTQYPHLLPKERRWDKEPTLKKACSRAYPGSASCVQRFDDSLNSAIRITYRISLRSSSLREPRYPLLRVVLR